MFGIRERIQLDNIKEEDNEDEEDKQKSCKNRMTFGGESSKARKGKGLSTKKSARHE